MLAVNRDQHWPLTAWLAMIILGFLRHLCLARTWRTGEDTRWCGRPAVRTGLYPKPQPRRQPARRPHHFAGVTGPIRLRRRRALRGENRHAGATARRHLRRPCLDCFRTGGHAWQGNRARALVVRIAIPRFVMIRGTATPLPQRSKRPDRRSGDQALTCTYLVAAAGFESATSGL